MERKALTQEYFLLAVNENGTMPLMHREESTSGIVAAGYMELLLHEVISVEKKKITVVRELPDACSHLAPLYQYLSEKTRSIHKLMSDYMASTGARIKQLTAQIGASLCKDGSTVASKGGLFGGKTVYIPQKECKNALIAALKSAITQDGELSPQDMALLCLLKETKNLYQYFSRHEGEQLNARLKEVKKNPQNKQLAKMISYVSDLTAMIAVCAVVNS